MPKVTLEFNLPEDKDELRYAQNGPDYRSALAAIDELIRVNSKYQDNPVTDWHTIKDHFWSIMNDHEVSIL